VSEPGIQRSARLGTVTVVLVVIIAAIGFLFDTYELLMFPVIGSNAIAELEFGKKVTSLSPEEEVHVQLWAGRMQWIAALCGGGLGLLGGLLIDRLGRKSIMIAAILAYSVSPVAAAFSWTLWQLILFRCTTFMGVCVEMVAAVTWLAELFEDKRTRELVIGWTLATASLGGLFVTLAYSSMVAAARSRSLPALPFPEGFMRDNVAWRFTLLTGLIPGALILLMMPFVPESGIWRKKRQEGTLKRPSFGELFSSDLRRTTIVTTVLSACGYAAAFGAIQMTPLIIVRGLPDIVELTPKSVLAAEAKFRKTKADTPERAEAVENLVAAREAAAEELQKAEDALRARRGNIQLWQELGGLLGRILLAVLLLFVPSRTLIRLFLIPGVFLFPLTYFQLVHAEYVIFATAIFFCGLLTVAQFSFLSEFLPRVFPMHLRGTGGSFATNLGGRMIGTMAAALNTEVLAGMFTGTTPMRVAMAAGVIGGSVYLIAFLASFLLPSPHAEVEKQAKVFGRDEALSEPEAETVD
jgi:MFS family permease